MSDVGTLAAMDAFAGGARRRPARLPPPPPFVPPPPPQRHDHYYVRRKSPVPKHSSNLTLFARTNGTSPQSCSNMHFHCTLHVIYQASLSYKPHSIRHND
ncbi:jg9974 [Pararge aegeria aegeria]|uniref:Jg9974 protein n=1 Tax=Pararge aegeria aegeria TaxID=348720 RepID=A0A8S4S8K8_9NEOP|nr:jg9974 [Pararge aegeria aegeria]